MKRCLFFIVIGLLLNSCSSNKYSEVKIKTDSNTIKDGAIFNAELYVSYKDSILPSFFITKDLDTFRLPIDASKKCAYFKAVGRGEGEKTYNGYVEYTNKRGEKEKKTYSIKFFVKP